MIREKEEDGEKYLSVETEDEFNKALNRSHPIVHNPMGLVISYLQGDRAVVTDPR